MRTEERAIKITERGVPNCCYCGDPVRERKWTERADGTAFALKNAIHQGCRVRRAKEQKARAS